MGTRENAAIHEKQAVRATKLGPLQLLPPALNNYGSED